MSNVLKKIKANMSKYGSSQEHLAKFILSNHQTIPNMTITALAKSAYCSPSSVSRFVNKLGFDSYYDFCHHLKQGAIDSSEFTTLITALNNIDSNFATNPLDLTTYNNIFINCNSDIKYLVCDAITSQTAIDHESLFFNINTEQNNKLQTLANINDLTIYIYARKAKSTRNFDDLKSSLIVFDLYGTLSIDSDIEYTYCKLLGVNNYQSNTNKLLISHLLTSIFKL